MTFKIGDIVEYKGSNLDWKGVQVKVTRSSDSYGINGIIIRLGKGRIDFRVGNSVNLLNSELKLAKPKTKKFLNEFYNDST